MSYSILKQTRVLDLTMVFSGPTCSRILASLGAEIIKIESSIRPDVFTRSNVYPENEPGLDPWNRGSFFHSLNAGKVGITLNLGIDKGRELFKRLVQISDVVVENYSPRVMESWGLGYSELKKIKPDIIMASLSGLGHTGPLKDFYMYVPGLEGMSGLTNLTGYPDQPPMLSGFSYGDWVLGAMASAGIITALYYRERSGKGQYLDISGREALTSLIGEIVTDYTINHHEQSRSGNHHPYMAPHGCYRCIGDDNWINIVVENDAQWENFCEALGSPEWMKQEKFSNSFNRWVNRKDLDAFVENWTRQHDKFEVMDLLQKSGIAAGAVLNMEEIALNDHLIERGFFDIIDHGSGIGKRPIPKQLPAHFNSFDSFIPRRAPRFGEDNNYVFRDLLGMPEEELLELENQDIIGGLPTFPQGKSTRLDLIKKQGAGKLDSEYISKLSKKYQTSIGESQSE